MAGAVNAVEAIGWRWRVFGLTRERLSMLKSKRFPAAVIVVAAVLIGVTILEGGPAADASTNSVVASPTKGLIVASKASRLGFPMAVGKPFSSKKTGVAGCTNGAEARFANTAKATGLISEVLVCKSASVPAGVLKKERNASAVSAAMKPPKMLGTTAFERLAGQSTYGIYWQRGRILEFVAIDINIAASSTTSSTTATVTPLTQDQQRTLSNAALAQDAAAK
jgi:hypothetical protein